MSTRLERLRALLVEHELEALYVGDLVNIRYLTGFTGSHAGLLVPADGDPVFWTDGRYAQQAPAECAAAGLDDLVVLITRDILGRAQATAADFGLRLAAETHVLSVDDWRALGMPESAGRLVEQLRVVKDDTEVAALREACEISCEALLGLLSGPVVGRTERDLALDLERRMLRLGAQDKAFDTILAAGENSAVPHHQPTDRVIGADELLKIDFGAAVRGYHADCTRTVVTGTADAFMREIHATVRVAQRAGVEALVDGADLSEPWRAAVEQLEAAGWRHAFTTGLSHGVGLAIHEDPFPGERATGRLAGRTVLTMEPGIYVPGRGGVRIEDTVLVTDGAPEVLTDVTTELWEIG